MSTSPTLQLFLFYFVGTNSCDTFGNSPTSFHLNNGRVNDVAEVDARAIFPSQVFPHFSNEKRSADVSQSISGEARGCLLKVGITGAIRA